MKKPGLRLGIGLFVCLSAFIPSISGQGSVSEPGYVPGEALVRYRPQASRARRDAIIAERGAKVLRRLDAVNVDHVVLPAGVDITAAARLLGDADVLSVEPNYLRDLVAGPNDPYYVNGNLWGLKKIQAEAAWLLTTGSTDIVVANLDTGVNYAHPDLAANMWRNSGEVPANGVDDDRNGYVDDVYGIDTANNDSDPMDDHGHGTHTAGTIGGVGNNGTGVVGINWKVRILPCKFFKATGSGSDADAIECFNYIVALKKKGVNVRVSSNSWGSLRDATGSFPQALKDAIDAAGAAGIINVFAAGNNGYNIDSKPFDPASFTSASIVTVAASDSADNRASFSNYGATAVDLAAPGVSIVSSTVSGYGAMSGTSMATPHVAGAAALLAASNPTLTVAGLKSLMMTSVDPLAQWSGVVASGGRLNLFTAALDAGGDIAPTATLTSPVNAAKFTAPATVTLSAAASDPDGTIAKVDFYANGTMIGTDTTSPYSINWTNVQAGTYSLTAVATDNRTFTGTSAAVGMTVENATVQIAGVNVAAAANGGTVSASSRYSSLSAASYATDGNRRASSSANSWADGTISVYPDWLRVDFNGSKSIGQIDIFTGQTNGAVDPTPTMTSGYAIADFQVQYWTGAQWTTVPGGSVTGNQNVWRTFKFTPVTTSAIRVLITRSGTSLSRIGEIEAYAASSSPAPVPPPAPTGGNVASAINGGRVSASSRYTTLTAASYATDGNRRASSSANSWADGTINAYPDWLQVDFNGAKAITKIDIFTGQTDGSVDPTASMTSGYALADFQVQYWTGSQWTAVPGGIVTGNQNVWRTFTFPSISTAAIRVLITRSRSSLSRIGEIEAYEGTATTPPTTAAFEVGPGKAFATPSDVPWETLSAGDTVLIYWRSTPYKNKWVISGQGTATAPIVIRGVPGPEGQLPVIDGNGAVTRLALDYWNESRAVIKIGGSSIPADTMPRHIIIEHLDVRSGRPPYTFIDHKGAIQSYLANAAAITIEKGENITLRNNRLRDSGNGLFVASGGTNISRNILIEGNEIFDNGNLGSAYEHNSYTEALGITFQYNHYGPLKAGSVGTNLKDRSAGAVVRYNWIEGGNRVLDLVDSGNATIRASSLYRTTHAYGNVLLKLSGVANQQVTQYGGDSGTPANYRKGILFFYNNTVISTRTDRTTLFGISTNEERVDARNNIAYVTAAGTTLSLLNATGTLAISHNWFKPGVVRAFGVLTGIVTDDGTSVYSSSPGFQGESTLDFRLTAYSPARHAGTTFATAFLASHSLTNEYVKHQGKRARKQDGAIDLGAFEVE